MIHPCHAMLDDRIAIVGTAGSGKTYAAKGMVERLVNDGSRVCIVDALGVWWGLRAPGAGHGLAVIIIGGAHGDVPLAEDDGPRLAEILAGDYHRVLAAGYHQVVVDLSEMGSGAARRRFMRGFLATLRERNTDPLHLVLDEADLWAPQRPQQDATALLHEVDEIVRRGRVRGFIPWLITQRPAVLAKDVLSQADVLIAMKLTSAQDRAAIGAWIEGQADRAEQKALLAALPKLARGHGYVWAPALDVLQEMAFPPIQTFDSSATPSRRRATQPGALVSVESAAASLREMLEQQSEGGGDQDRPRPQGEEPEWRLGYTEGLEAGRREAIFEIDGKLAQARYELAECQAAINAACGHLMRVWNRAGPLGTVLDLPASPLQTVDAEPEPPPVDEVTPVRPVPPRLPSPPPAAMPAGPLHMLRTLAARHPAALSEAQWATLARRARKGGTWAASRRALEGAGLVERRNGRWAMTEAGFQSHGIDAPPQPSTAAEILAEWKRALGTGPARMLDMLAAHPKGLDRQQLAGLVRMTAAGGTFSSYVRALIRNELVTEGRDRKLRLAAILLGTNA